MCAARRRSLFRPPLFDSFLILVLVVMLGWPVATAPDTAAEVRGLWVLRDSLVSPQAVARVVHEAATNGFNTLFVQVRGRGDAYFRGGIEPVAQGLRRQATTFDPLSEVIALAHGRGLAVHAWVNVNLVSSARDLPQAESHIVNRRPEWLMLPRALAADLPAMAPRDPRFVKRLAAWSLAQPDVEGLFTSPIMPGVADYVAALVGDVAARYAIDGVHLDYVRYPNAEFDYSQGALAEFRATVVPDLTPDELSRLDARRASESLVYADTFPVRWNGFRRTRLTALVMRVRTAVELERPKALITAAVVPDSEEALERRLQDWALWLDSGLLDAICPMVYTQDAGLFGQQISRLAQGANRGRIWAGIGAYRLTPAQTASNIAVARRAGMGGVVLFSYDSVRESVGAKSTSYLASVRRLAFQSSPRVGEARR